VPQRARLAALVVASAGAAWPLVGRAFSNVAVGAVLDNPTLPTLDGSRQPLLSEQAAASVFVFFRPRQDHSRDALAQLGAIQRSLAGKGVRFVLVVSDAWPAEEVRATVAGTGLVAPVLVDHGDALYGALGVALHPVLGIADRRRTLVAYEHYRRINFGEIVLGRLRLLLGEIGEAEMARILEPERAAEPGAGAGARRFLNLARMLEARGHHEKALEAVERSLAAGPTAAGLALKGAILAARGDCAAARPAFEAALKLDPADAVALQGRKGCAR
jgi:tetratricopeptide (TPR) repeat protein